MSVSWWWFIRWNLVRLSIYFWCTLSLPLRLIISIEITSWFYSLTTPMLRFDALKLKGDLLHWAFLEAWEEKHELSILYSDFRHLLAFDSQTRMKDICIYNLYKRFHCNYTVKTFYLLSFVGKSLENSVVFILISAISERYTSPEAKQKQHEHENGTKPQFCQYWSNAI